MTVMKSVYLYHHRRARERRCMVQWVENLVFLSELSIE